MCPAGCEASVLLGLSSLRDASAAAATAAAPAAVVEGGSASAVAAAAAAAAGISWSTDRGPGEQPKSATRSACHVGTRHSTAQHSTAQHSTAQHSTAQHSTAQHSAAQHSTAQRSTRTTVDERATLLRTDTPLTVVGRNHIAFLEPPANPVRSGD